MSTDVLRRRVLSYFGCIGLAQLFTHDAFAGEYILVANKSVGMVDSTLDEMRKILSLRQAQWQDGASVVLVLPPRHSGPMLWLSEELLRMPEATYRRLVLGQVFRGAARPPIQAESIAAAAQAVATKPYSLSVLPRGALLESVHRITLRGIALLAAVRFLFEYTPFA
jgi:hypothetical protein